MFIPRIAIIVLSPYMPGFDPSLDPTWLYCYVHLTPGIHCDILHHFTAFLVPSVVLVCLLLDLLYSFNCMPVDHRLIPCCFANSCSQPPAYFAAVWCVLRAWDMVLRRWNGAFRFKHFNLDLNIFCLFVCFSFPVRPHSPLLLPTTNHTSPRVLTARTCDTVQGY